MPEVFLVRHAAATGQAPDAPLTKDGERQAELLAELLSAQRIACVVSSPFLRATQSIAPFCQRAGLEVEVEPRLAERVLSRRELPDWREHLRRSFDDMAYCVESGESAQAAQLRAVAVLDEALASARRCALITHGNLLALLLKFMDASFGFDAWSKLSTPDVFVVRASGAEPPRFERIWQPR